jgi:monoamine oxidase
MLPDTFAMTTMTRRDFLERFGAAGGTTLVMGALTAWDLMAAQGAIRPNLAGRVKSTRVAILGGGLTGLMVGYELGKLGYDCRILEARDRVGGVAWSVRRGTEHTELGAAGERQACSFDEGLYVNAGPWRIPHFHTGVLDYCKELGVPLQIFINETEGSYCYFEGPTAGVLANKRIRLREVKADLAGYTSELLAKAVDQGKLDQPLTAEDKERLVAFLVSHGYLDSADHAYTGGPHRGPGDPYDFRALLQPGFSTRARSVIAGTGQAPMFQPIGGMDQFPKAFQRKLAGRITFGAEVQSIHQTADAVRVAYVETKSDRHRELAVDYCVSCLPLSVLKTLDVDLSPDMAAAVKATSYSPSAKMGLQMRRRFWEDDDRIFGGHLYSDLPLGEFSYPSNDYFTHNGILLGLYTNSRIANLEELPVHARVEHVLTHASKVHPQIRQEFESAYSVWWSRVKYSLGGYATGGAASRVAQLAKPDNRLYLGCAAVSSDPAWMEGACEAAWHAVESLHDRAMRT